jgi:hypothetical protein
MATSADQRLLQLLDTWLASLELHLKYASLDAESYARVQPWPPHQRPTRWIIDIARQKALALKALIEERMQMGDGKFSDALEMTMFLANLVGAQHIERFIPLASPANEQFIELAPAETGSMSLTTNAEISLPERLASAVTGTREMPQFVAKTRAPPPAGTAHVARAERSSAAVAAVPATPAATPAAAAAPRPARAVARGAQRSSAGKQSPTSTAQVRAADAGGGEPSAEARAKVLADAERLLQWGRKWHELAELIARMADRPSLSQVRRILKDNKSKLDAEFKR